MVRALCFFVGGGFGCKGSMWMFSPLTAAAARALDRPVKTILTREQMFTLVGHRPALIQHLTLGASSDGTLQAVKHDVLSTISFSKVFVEAAAHRTSRLLYSLPTSRSVTRWSVGCGRPDFHARSRNAGGDCELGLQRDRKEGARVPDPAGKNCCRSELVSR
jgi:xanthine dehydrogenase YagR molybdenum-binding subunit